MQDHAVDFSRVVEIGSTLVGCCGWSQSKAKYVADFPVIELQSTFYEPPSVALAHKWRSLAPSSFEFSLKAWQLITHSSASPTYRKLKSKLSISERDLVGSFQPTEQVWLAWERTAEVARALQAVLVLFQCPASFTPESANLNNLKTFFSDINRHGLKFAWEPRGAWPSDLVAGLCQELQLLRCVDPFQAPDDAANAPYWRLHGKTGYSYRYSDDDLAELFSRLGMSRGNADEPRYVFFNNIWMKDDALRFQRLLHSQRSAAMGSARAARLAGK